MNVLFHAFNFSVSRRSAVATSRTSASGMGSRRLWLSYDAIRRNNLPTRLDDGDIFGTANMICKHSGKCKFNPVSPLWSLAEE
jgi:hypothetical protein